MFSQPVQHLAVAGWLVVAVRRMYFPVRNTQADTFKNILLQVNFSFLRVDHDDFAIVFSGCTGELGVQVAFEIYFQRKVIKTSVALNFNKAADGYRKGQLNCCFDHIYLCAEFSIPGFQKFMLLNERLPDAENEIMTPFMQSLVRNNILILSFQFG